MSPIGLAEQLHRLGRRADVQSFNGFNRQQIEVAGVLAAEQIRVNLAEKTRSLT